MMTPLARLVLVRATPRNDLVGAMAWLTVPGLIGPLVGPPVGGFITTYFTWHWIFLINVPIGLIGIYLAGRFLPEVELSGTPPLDVKGLVLSGIAASGVVFGLSVVSLPALPPIVGVLTLIAGLVAAVLYLRHSHAASIRSSTCGCSSNSGFRAAVLGGSLFRIGNGAVPFLLPLMFQLGFGMTPFESGMLTFATAFGAIGMKFLAKTTLQFGGLPVGADRGRLDRVLLHRGERAFYALHAAHASSSRYWSAAASCGRCSSPRPMHWSSPTSTTRQASQATAIAVGVPADHRRARRRGRRRHPRNQDLPPRRQR